MNLHVGMAFPSARRGNCIGIRMKAKAGLVTQICTALLIATATAARIPYPPSPVIEDVQLDWLTHRREALGSDNWQLAWADDDHQYGAWGDGGGFAGSNNDGRVGLGFGRIEGNGDNYKGFNVWGGKKAENPATFSGKSWGTICIDGILYSWIVPDEPDTGGPRDHYRYIQLAKSGDHGAHWTKAPWRWTIEDNLIVPTFLINGKNNAQARDGYIYSYFIRPQSTDVTQATFGLAVHKPGGIFLARVAKDKLFAGREAYEWFAGMDASQPRWGSLSEKKCVLENPDGTGWCLSAVYNHGIKRYLLATEHTASHAGLMALFDAPEPWGPWTTVRYWRPDEPFGSTRSGSKLDWDNNVFFFSFAPKWFSPDGRNFTLVFTGGGHGKNNDSFNTVRGTFLLRNLRPRLMVLTDIGGDPDDQQSMIRLMTYSNEFEIEGLVATASGMPGELKDAVTRPDLIRQIVLAYGQVRDNLMRHAEGWPETDALLACIKSGNPHRGRENIGEGHDTEGSRWLIERIDAGTSERPLNITIWGGQTDLAQALWRVKQDRGAAGLADFVKRFRVFDIGDQDGIAEWMHAQFPGMWYILSRPPAGKDRRLATYRGMYLGGDESLTSRDWVDRNVRSKGPLGALYPTKTWTAPNPHGCLKEGDTPSWFFFLPSGGNDPAEPLKPGWGGRYEKAPEGWYRDLPLDRGDPREVISSRRPVFQADFARRMSWCVPVK